MQITKLPERTSVRPLTMGFEDFLTPFLSPWFESTPRARLPEVFNKPSFPAVNISETDKTLIITLDLPGLEEKDIDVKLMGQQLTITAERKWEEEKKGREFHRVESQYGMFERTIALPDNLRTQYGEAAYKKGVLTVTFPKVEPTPTAKIKVTKGE
jgi:HSP20 family protein